MFVSMSCIGTLGSMCGEPQKIFNLPPQAGDPGVPCYIITFVCLGYGLVGYTLSFFSF